MKLTFISVTLCVGLLWITGCSAINKGLDKAKEPAKELGKPVGKVMDVVGSVSEGAVDGMDEKDQINQENPFNR